MFHLHGCLSIHLYLSRPTSLPSVGKYSYTNLETSVSFTGFHLHIQVQSTVVHWCPPAHKSTVHSRSLVSTCTYKYSPQYCQLNRIYIFNRLIFFLQWPHKVYPATNPNNLICAVSSSFMLLYCSQSPRLCRSAAIAVTLHSFNIVFL
jgi:hypothetical protein